MLSVLALLVASLAALSTTVQAQLVENFYRTSCPSAETVITSAVNSALNRRAASAAGVLRIHFHDCFVHGCDASVLIDSPSEKDAPPNGSLQGFEVIDAAKTAIEKRCPGIVSCADITAMASQIAVKKLSGGKITWKVPLGRRDGLVSSAADVAGKLPAPTANVATLKSIFAGVGLTTEEMVVLSGAHSVGVASCRAVQNRLTTPPDATLDPTYAQALQRQCPAGSPNNVNLDVTTPTRLDEVYFKNLQARKGLLTSDQVLHEDPETKPMVAKHTSQGVFNEAFKNAMRKMSDIGVLTGSAGEIRANCHRFNA